MDEEFIKYLASLGVGGVLAGVMFYLYRKDSERHIAAWKGQSEALIATLKENTACVTKQITLLELLHQRLDRPDAPPVNLRPGDPKSDRRAAP